MIGGGDGRGGGALIWALISDSRSSFCLSLDLIISLSIADGPRRATEDKPGMVLGFLKYLIFDVRKEKELSLLSNHATILLND